MASQPVEGVINTVSEKPWTDRQSGQPITLYSFTLQGSNRWYRTGQEPVPFNSGQAVKFVVDGNNVDVKTLEEVQGYNPPPKPAATAGGMQQTPAKGAARTTASTSRDSYWADKERRDIEKDERYQNVDIPRMTRSTALNVAAQVTVAALQTGALSLGNVKASKKLEVLEEYVLKVADRFYVDIVSTPSNPPTLEENNNEAVGDSLEDGE